MKHTYSDGPPKVGHTASQISRGELFKASVKFFAAKQFDYIFHSTPWACKNYFALVNVVRIVKLNLPPVAHLSLIHFHVKKS